MADDPFLTDETLEAGLRTLLLSLDAVTAISTCVRPEQLRQEDVEPAIVIEVMHEECGVTLDGLGGLTAAEVAIVCLARDKTTSRQLEKAVRTNGTDPGTGLGGYTGPAGANFAILGAACNEREFGFEPDEEGGDTGVYWVAAVYVVHYNEVQ